ncbi:hypothetical protein GIB67_025745 [Kingdonia uniflora]|uniref:Transposase n=1 Tax=Kingdonia uniflora TaxID=39325 RepID=A0A7J7MZA0_9MAGN|nr:hypothetical protein GIB67_025745 [Kingdonia uniflora]
MVNDILEHLSNEVNIEDEVNVEAHVEATTFICNNEENLKYKELMEDALLPLYPSYREEHTRLAVVVMFLSMKSRYEIFNECFTKLLGYVKGILPDDNTLLNRTYTTKKLVKSSRMECQIIQACRNDCILYWRENVDKDSCPTCGISKWRSKNPLKPKLNKPWKKLRYFPLTPRLRRMYSVPWIANEMTWHAKANLIANEDTMKHPVDASC